MKESRRKRAEGAEVFGAVEKVEGKGVRPEERRVGKAGFSRGE